MANYAEANLIGHLGKDPELRSLPSGDQVATISLATTRKRQDQEITTWWRCAVWGKPAGIVMQYVRKGDPLHVVGEPMLRPYSDSEGVNRVLELNVARFTLLGARKDAPVAYTGQTATKPSQAQQAASAAVQAPSGGGMPFDDDIPFDVAGRGLWA